MSGAYLMAVSQTPALGPLPRLSQATVLRGYSHRWGGWIVADIGSWLIVDAAFSVLSQQIDLLDLSRHDGSIARCI